jgi:hypothetical protein
VASLSDLVRDYARREYIDPARVRGDRTVRIRAGDVHRALHFTNRVPLVCNALASKGFLERNQLQLESRQGPPSGLSTTATFTYRIADSGSNSLEHHEAYQAFLGLRGIFKEMYAELGGGEAFIQSERDEFNKSWPGRHEEP